MQITPAIFALDAQVLRQLPPSLLWQPLLLQKQASDYGGVQKPPNVPIATVTAASPKIPVQPIQADGADIRLQVLLCRALRYTFPKIFHKCCACATGCPEKLQMEISSCNVVISLTPNRGCNH